MKYDIIYLVQHQDIPQYTKIGFTSRHDLSKRMKELNTASPTGIVLVQQYNVKRGYGRKFEQVLHNKYKSYNSNGEWFQLSENQLSEIDSWLNSHI